MRIPQIMTKRLSIINSDTMTTQLKIIFNATTRLSNAFLFKYQNLQA